VKKYLIRVEQDFEVKADSFEEASKLLPSYGWSPNPAWVMVEETIEMKEASNV
jgi:hypothetical protein